jgi:hypothetical protein
MFKGFLRPGEFYPQNTYTNSLSLANFVGRAWPANAWVVGFLNPPRRTCGDSSLPKLIL